MKRKRMLDLCAGLGGASEAFILDPGWEVVRIENNPLLASVPGTQERDITEWLDWIDAQGEFDLVWASVPCTDFSNGYSAPKIRARREGIEYNPDLSLLLCAKAIIEHLNPTWWVIENVVGATEFFNPILGRPTQIIIQFVLWGKFPYIAMPAGWTHSKFANDTWSSDPLRANRRGLVPYEISRQLKRSIETQTTLGAWS